jgi:DNA-binding transcriptional LysR family regulator
MMETGATQLSTIAIFCKSAELGSFTAAANVMGLTPAAVSRGISRLEGRLGIKLFRRTTRSMSLTDDGRLYFDQCRSAITQIEDAEKLITGQQTVPRGMLRISVPSTYAHYRLLPALTNFRTAYPEIALNINISNRNIDFVEDGYDLVIRLGTPPDSRLIARKLEDAPVGVYASRSYLKKFGTPRTIEELQTSRFTLLPFLQPSTGKLLPWIFLYEGKEIEINPRSSVHISDGPIGCVILARHGVGLVQTFSWIAQTYKDEFMEVLPEYAGRTRPFYLIYPQNRHLSARVRALVDFLT